MLQTFKKQRQESRSFPNLVQPLLDDNKANKSNTTNLKGESKTWFWYDSTNESDSNSEEEGYSDVDMEKSNLEGEQPSHKKSTKFKREQSSHERMVKLKSELKKIRWSKEGETKLQGGYRKGSCATLTRKKNQLKN